MKNVDSRRRIDTLNTERMLLVVDLADENALVAILRQMLCDIVDRVHNPNIEMIGPVPLGIGWWRMPVILFLVIDQHGQFTRRMNQVTIRCRCQR